MDQIPKLHMHVYWYNYYISHANTFLDLQGKYTVTLIEGDGIGPEISQSVKDIFAAAEVCRAFIRY